MADQAVRFVIKRQATPEERPHWEEFELRWRAGMNVITGLMDIAENPVDRFGKSTTPVTYDSNCLEEVCGSCAMLINVRAAMACSALLISSKSQSGWSRCRVFRCSVISPSIAVCLGKSTPQRVRSRARLLPMNFSGRCHRPSNATSPRTPPVHLSQSRVRMLH